MEYKSTRNVAGLLGVMPGRISRAIWEGRLSPPEKAPGGSFLWIQQDIERASWLFRNRDAGDILDINRGEKDERN